MPAADLTSRAEHVLTSVAPSAIAYLDELAADIAAHGGFGDDSPMEAMQKAHDRRREFAVEMVNGSTDRARMARIALCASVYANLVVRDVTEGAIEQCGYIAEGTRRRSMGFAA